MGMAALMAASSVAVFVGCGKNGDKLVWYSDTYISINEESKVSDAIRKKTGLNFMFDSSTGSTTDKLSLMISSNSLPDIISMKASDERFRQLANEGYLWSVEELCEKYNLTIDVDIDIKQIYQVNGKTYGLPNYYYLSDENETLETNGGMMVRKDWFEAYMEYVIDNNLTNVDQDGNGICDYDITSAEGATYAMRWVYDNCVPEDRKNSYFGMLLDPFIPSTSYQGVAWLCQYFGVRFEDDKGNYVDGAETSQFKQVVQFLNTLYNNDSLHAGEPKLLPQAALAHTAQSQVGEVLARGDAFIFCGTPQDYPAYWAAGRYPEDPNATPVEYVSMVIKNDQREDPQLGDIAGTGFLMTCIPKSCKNPEAAAKTLAYLWSNEGQELTGYGIKGIADDEGNITSVADGELAEIFTTDDVTYYVDKNGRYHYTQNYLDILSSGDEAAATDLGVAQWTLLYRPSYMDSRNWGREQTNKESAYINNLKKPLSMYSISYHVCDKLLDPLRDYKAEGMDVSYSDLTSIQTRVNARWANMVTTIIGAKDWKEAETVLANGIEVLNKLGHDKLYQAYNISYGNKKEQLKVTYGYPLNDPNYKKKEISEGGRYTWQRGGKTYEDVWGARGDINYYKDYEIV